MSDTSFWQRLETQVRGLCDTFPGVMGVCAKELTQENSLHIRSDELFPTASTIKIHILTQLLSRAERGELDLAEKIRVTSEMLTPGSGILTYLAGTLELSVLDLANLMIIVSDNTTTNLCIDLAGIDETNALLRDLGLSQTMLRRKMQDYDAVARNDENVSTPAECVAMLEHLYQGRPTPQVAEQTLTILKKPNRGPIQRGLPDISVASKPGGMTRVRCDAGIVFLSRRPYIIAVMTKYGLGHPLDQEMAVVDVVRTIHETMVALDDSSVYGQGIPAQLLGGSET
ncbi:class A beta-lactamase-related serine hydrolase [Chloroflexi bacterium TSY]|nr:class A beta-lactamase-related serine hydrolase [Chloroflexi bacterium TSY]